MLITRLHRINEHFRARLVEWLLAGILFSWGWTLLLPFDTFAVTPTMRGLAQLASETEWGIACLVIGSGRLAILIVNGAWKRNAHGRMLCAILSSFFWFNISAGLVKSGIVAPGMGIYPMLLAVDLYLIMATAAEARMTDEGLRRGKH